MELFLSPSKLFLLTNDSIASSLFIVIFSDSKFFIDGNASILITPLGVRDSYISCCFRWASWSLMMLITLSSRMIS